MGLPLQCPGLAQQHTGQHGHCDRQGAAHVVSLPLRRTVALPHHFFFLVAVHLHPSPQKGLPTVPVILVGDSIVPSKVTVRGGLLPEPLCSQPNITLFPFTVPVTFCSPIGPMPGKTPVSFSPACLKTNFRLTGLPSLPIYTNAQVPEISVAPAPPIPSDRPSKTTISSC